MNNEKYYNLIEKLEKMAKESPKDYKRRTFLLLILGYGYIFGILFVLFVVSALLIINMLISGSFKFFKIAIALLGLSYYIIKGLWEKIYPPGGIPLMRKDCPELFKEVDKIVKSLKSSKVHHIYITDEYNASIVSVPKFGLFGFYKNYLFIGLPLILASSVEELRAILAHEIAHLSSKHGRSGVLIYRVRETWNRILLQLEQKEHWGNIIFSWFFRRYIPFFEAYSSVYKRLAEHEADKLAAQLVGVDTYTNMLINTSLKLRALNKEFWKKIYKRNKFQYKPPIDVFTRLQIFLKQGFDCDKLRIYLSEIMGERTNIGDTHPCIKDRIEVIGGKLKELTVVVSDAAPHYFSKELLDELSVICSRHWYEGVENKWSKRYSNFKRYKIKLNSLEKYGKENLDVDGLYYYAYYTHMVNGAEKAIPLYMEVLSLKEEHLKANYYLGKALLSLNNNKGLFYLERAINISEKFLEEAYVKCHQNTCWYIYNYYSKQGYREKAQEYYNKALRHNEMVECGKKERSILSYKDEFICHDLDENHVNRIINILKKHPEISEAYLMKKKVKYFKHNPIYILGVKVRVMHNYKKVIKKLVNSGNEINLDIFILPLSLSNWIFRITAKKIEGARIYLRSTYH
ncbi:MAG: M48 family metallopeptidase [Caloramator sp.]|nr:M48 family metallopeptidase [Caloramator sp.]